MSVGVNPVFLKDKDIPESVNKRPAVLEMCTAAERAAGQGTIVGAQNINGLWRLYPATKEARSALLVKGLTIRGTVLQVSNNNPFVVRGDTGEERPCTKVWIDNIPLSVADSEIEHALLKNGCEMRSAIKTERARDNDHKLTRFLTGRRFVFISVPSVPLEKTLKISIFTAKIFHYEQKLVKRVVTCTKCFEQGHYASQCENEVVCTTCRKPGHKRGDPACDSHFAVTSRPGEEVNAEATESSGTKETTADSQPSEDRRDRGRSHLRQTTLSLQTPSQRHRSETPKRPRSRDDKSSPSEVTGGKEKQAKKGKEGAGAPSKESEETVASVRG